MDTILDGKSTVRILRSTLNKMEPRLTSHGDRVAYIFYHMLKIRCQYPKRLMDNFLILGILHDICAYKTDEIDNMLTFDSNGVWSHSVYGFLYLKYLSPLYEISETLLYHHLDYNKFNTINYQYKNESMLLFIADRVDIAMQRNHNKPNFGPLEEKRNTMFWGEGLDIFYKADEKYNLTGHLADGSYEKKLEYLTDKIEMSIDECIMYMRLLVYMIDFKTERTTARNVNTSIISKVIAREMHLDFEDEEKLNYASTLYDIGMLGMPNEILRAPRKLTKQERDVIYTHVNIMEGILKGNISQDIINIASAHHERLNGSGYPRGLSGNSLSLPQRILAVSDVIAALNADNERRDAYDKKEIIKIISREAMEGKLCNQVTRVFLKNYDYIMNTSIHLYQNTLKNYWAIKDQYSIIIKRFDAYNTL